MADRPCSICSHPSRLAIDQALLNGKGLRPTAVAFGIGSGEFGTPSFKPDHKKVQRHIDKCMGEAYRAAKEADLVQSGRAIILRIQQMDEIVDEVLAQEREGVPITDEHGVVLHPVTGEPIMRRNNRVVLAAVAESRKNNEFLAKLAGALPEGDEDAASKARAALADPNVRKAMADVDAAMAALDQ